ncbi:MAG: ABC transporter permease [Lachnospiraceae bacterium]|nr:ABC transporter permease [Lachnospiraceae bacterium]
MKLYKMELYKLIHRKIVIVGAFCIIGILLFFFMIKVADESAYVDGVTYTGYQAVQVNRQITEEFKGVLTDEKVDAIIEKYGFPQEVVRDYGGFRDSNFLNDFVTEYLADGFMRGWEEGEYQVSTMTYPIAETELGAVGELTGKEILLEYTNGWGSFVDVLEVGMVLACILILFSVSVLFAGERQKKMLPLLFTTKEGKKKDIYVKIAAAFTVTICIWLAVVLLDVILCGLVYGYDGLDSFVGITNIAFFITAQSWSVSIWTVGHFLMVTLFRSLIGVVTLCAVTIFISAECQSSFHAVSIAAVIYGLPVLLWFIMPIGFIFSLIRLLIYASSFYQCMCNSIFDVSGIWHILAIIAVAFSFICVFAAYRKYKRQQAV